MSSPAVKSLHAGHRLPAEAISNVIRLYVRFPLSLRMVEEMPAAWGIVVGHGRAARQTDGRQWVLEFGQTFASQIRRRLPGAGDEWHLGEVAIRIAGVQHWPRRAVDQSGTVLDALLQGRRDKRTTGRLLRKLLMRQCRAPRVMATDKLGSHSAAKQDPMPGGEDGVAAHAPPEGSAARRVEARKAAGVRAEVDAENLHQHRSAPSCCWRSVGPEGLQAPRGGRAIP
jgi:putative transposase